MANNLSGGYGLRPIGLTGSAANTTVQHSTKLRQTTQMLFFKVALLFLLRREL